MPPFSPASSQAGAITGLFEVALGIGAVIFLIVAAAVFLALARYRERPNSPSQEPKPIFGNRRLELAWTIAPALILIFMLGMTINTMQKADPPAPDGQQPDIIVIGHQWFWEIRYPKLNVNTANELHLPVGRKMLVELRSADVIHSFWVPALSRKMDATPGMSVRLYLSSDQPGAFQGICAEYCGMQHAWMLFKVIAQPEADFNAWVQQESQVPVKPTSGEAARGAQLFQQLTCANCHAISGTPANKTYGPDLTHLASRQTLAGGAIQNTPGSLKAWVINPQLYKPGALMPSFPLNDADANALIAYLETLK